MSKSYRGIAAFIMFLFGLSATSFAQVLSSNFVEKVKLTVSTIETSSSDAATMREMAVLSVRNAGAAENDAVEAFLAAVKSDDRKKISSAKKFLAGVSSSALEARDSLESIAGYASEVRNSADAAKDLEKNIMVAKDQKEALKLFAKVEKLARAADKTLREVRLLVEPLKKKWLIPVSSPKPLSQPDR